MSTISRREFVKTTALAPLAVTPFSLGPQAPKEDRFDIVIAGAGAYFSSVRTVQPGRSPEQHTQWGLDYANEVLASYRHVPIWILGLVVPRNVFPPEDRDMEALADEMSNRAIDEEMR